MQSTPRRWERPPPDDPDLPLFPPANAAPTSQAAAAAIVPHVAGQQQRVLAALRAAGEYGRTNEELANELDMRLSSVAARRGELVRMHLARETDRTRQTTSGRAAAVIIAT